MTTKRTAALAFVAGDRASLTAAESLGLTVAAIREAGALHALAHRAIPGTASALLRRISGDRLRRP